MTSGFIDSRVHARARGRRRRVAAVTLVSLVALGVGGAIASFEGEAFATNPLNSSDRTTASAQAACTNGDRDEFNIVPIAGGTSDIGIGVGQFSDLARVGRGWDPYLWNIESAAFISVKQSDGHLKVPYQDFYFMITVPRFLGTGVQLEIRPSYTWETTLNYFGMGNNSSSSVPPGSPDSYSFYGRLHPTLDLEIRWRLLDHVAALLGTRYTQNWLQISQNSKLEQDIQFGSPEVKKLIGPTNPGGVALFSYGLQWDSRDSEISPNIGQFHEALFRLSPGEESTSFSWRYAQASLVARFYIPIVPTRLTLALRAVGDLLFGQPPFYELAKFDDTYALGGVNGVRGVPAQRFYGKIKVFGNIEARANVFDFKAIGKPLRFGFVTFFDGGRLWADWSSNPQLDGTGLGLHYGIGGGLRLQSGETFVLRADVAWGPDATPVQAYFSAGQTF